MASRDLHEINTIDPRHGLLAVTSGLGFVFGSSSLAELGDEGRNLVGRPLDPPLSLPDTVVAWRASAPRGLRSLLSGVREAARALHAEALLQGTENLRNMTWKSCRHERHLRGHPLE
jgi:DNA-binding transcriptional LysR family regulator